VIAEKFHAIVELGMDNSRMKDYFDLDHLAKTQSFDGSTLAQAVQGVFERRGTPLPDGTPVGLRPAFGEDAVKQTQWRAFVRRLHMEENAPELNAVAAGVKTFLIPPVEALRLRGSFDASWTPGGPWGPK